MNLKPDYQPEFDSLKTLLLDMAQERSWEALLNMIGNRMLERPHMVLVRIWLVLPGDICTICPMREACPDQTACLHLVASKGHPISKTGAPTEILDDDCRRIPLGIGKIGRIAREGKDITIGDISKESQKESTRLWAEKENIHGFSGFPLVYKGDVLGVSAAFTRMVHTPDGEGQIWGRIIADHMAAAIANARAFAELKKITAEKERIESELEFAKRVQEGFLPEDPPQYPGYAFAAKALPAKFVGGDFFDFIPLKNNQLGIVLGDVSGKGVSAALFMARLLSDFRYISQNDPDPGRVLAIVNRILCERSRRGMFATAVFLLLDMKNRKLRMANAGHPPVLIRNREHNVVKNSQAGGIPLGILPEANFPAEEIQLNNGDLVFLYSDGAFEPFSNNREQFGLDRLCLSFSKSPDSPKEVIDTIQQSIKSFAGKTGFHDDLTLLAVQVL